jgi:DNA-3-methyladenine glycosylase II
MATTPIAEAKTKAKVEPNGTSNGEGKARTGAKRARKAMGRGVPRPALADETGPLIDGEAALDLAIARLRATDPATVDHMLAVGGRPPLRRREPGFSGLAAIVVAQQLSTSSATAIFGRLERIVHPLTPDTLLAASDETLRGLGLSIGKVRTLRAIAEAVLGGVLPLDRLGTMAAEDAHAAMVAVHGIGPWTADAFLLFCLGHPDAWPAGDLALQEAARVVLRCDSRPSTAELNRMGERWRPHRAVAARLLWAYYRVLKQGRGGMTLAEP